MRMRSWPEGLTYARDAVRREPFALRNSYFVNELTDDLSIAMVKRLQNRYGVEIWPWDRSGFTQRGQDKRIIRIRYQHSSYTRMPDVRYRPKSSIKTSASPSNFPATSLAANCGNPSKSHCTPTVGSDQRLSLSIPWADQRRIRVSLPQGPRR